MPAWSAWLLAPFHALAIATGAKSFRANPVLGNPTLNRNGLHTLRRRLALRMADWRRARLAPLLPPEHRAALQRDGFVAIRDFLPADRFAALRAEIMALDAPAREFVDGYTLTRLIPLDPTTLPGLPATAATLGSAPYRALHAFTATIRRAPYVFVQTIFSHVREAPPDAQSHFHADTFHATVKSWLLLTDLGPGDAAFTYVPGSHRPTRRHEAWERRVAMGAAASPEPMTADGSFRITEATLARLGYPAPERLVVPANTLIVADTSGFHRRGLATGTACRIAIWGYARGNPFLPFTGSGASPAGAIRLYWAMKDRLGRSGGWRWAGRRTPATPP